MGDKVLFGIKNVHVAKLTEASDGTISYGTPFAVKGVTGLAPEPQGETTTFYADNIAYYVASSNAGYEGDLTLAITPNEFLTQILGQEEDNNGAILEGADDKTARFALMFEGDGDESGRRWVYYDCTATRPNREFNTKEDTIKVGTETISINMKPRSSDNVIKAMLAPTEQNMAVYNTFFTQVYEKNASASV